MVWHIDGAPIVKSRGIQVWLVSAFLIEVPKYLRYCIRNILLLGLWYGPSKPDFELFQLNIVTKLKKLMNDGLEICFQGNTYHYFLNIQAELADLPAKAASLNMKQFNGRHGCSVCYHPGQKLNPKSMVWVYPFEEPGVRAKLRVPEDFVRHAEIAEETLVVTYGLKGYSAVLDILNVPYELPHDYMHLVVEGEWKRQILLMIKDIGPDNMKDINRQISKIKVPHDFHKKPRHLSASNARKAKATDHQLWLLHLLLPLLSEYLEPIIFYHLSMFVTAIQILNQDIITDTDCETAFNLLEHYQRLKANLYGDQAMTYTNHALLHLPRQVMEQGGPLILHSNFVFEGFIGTLKKQFHGTRGIIRQMIDNIYFVQNSHLLVQKFTCPPTMKEYLNTLLDKTAKRMKTHVDNNITIIGKLSNDLPLFDDFDMPVDLIEYLTQLNGVYAARVSVRHVLYHSLFYKLRKSSNSYSVSYDESGEEKYGDCLFFVKVEEQCIALINSYTIMESPLFIADTVDDDIINSFVESGVMGKNFRYVCKSNSIVQVPVQHFKSRIIYVPVDDSNGYVSRVLSSYQHD